MITPNDPSHAVIDAALADWRQGDCVLDGEHWFLHRAKPNAGTVEEDPAVNIESEVSGFVVITQSCDIVRKYKDRPYVAVSPLVRVEDANEMEKIVKGYMPQFAAVPALITEKLVADFDRVMTIDKQVVATWHRIRGCTTDVEARDFSRAAVRKFARFAFPNEFVEFAENLRNRIIEKHTKKSPEGEALRGLLEIRVRAAPSWDAAEVELMFWFIADSKDVMHIRNSGFLAAWEQRIPPKSRFKKVYCQIVTHRELTAEDYLESDQLDLDHLSLGS